MLRIGIDVGGTHTDAVLLRGDELLAWTKQLTTSDVLSGVLQALEVVLSEHPGIEPDIEAIMLGTTQFTNAVIERQQLAEVAAIRIGLPSGRGLPPKVGWPEDIARALGDNVYQIHGGTLYDGWPLAKPQAREIKLVIDDLKQKRVEAVAISAAFSPMNPEPEAELARQIRAELPDAHITQSHQIGGLGILERENAALLNTSLLKFADRVVDAFVTAVQQRGLKCRFFISQNDGTLMQADFARHFPALTFASGPTNSLRGASRLTGIDNAIVVDIGGTTSDIGVLADGFPRESNVVIEVGGVRTNFRMPDILAIGLGGGSRVSEDGQSVGPTSVGHQLVQEGLVFGGNTLTATDIAVASAGHEVGEPSRVSHLDPVLVHQASDTMHSLLDQNIERMKASSDPVPVILVGGGTLLVNQPLAAASETVQPDYAGVANAMGAAIAQVGGEAERMVSYAAEPRELALKQVRQQACEAAVAAGAAADSLRVVDLEETTMSYMNDNTVRLRVRVVGNIAGLSGEDSQNTAEGSLQ